MTIRVPQRCRACRGEGWRRLPGHPGTRAAAARYLERCRRCGGTGEAAERRYLPARRCRTCAAAFSPPESAEGPALVLCTWCLRRVRCCRRCGEDLAPARRGRPPVLCPTCSASRRRYAPRLTRPAEGESQGSGGVLGLAEPAGSYQGG